MYFKNDSIEAFKDIAEEYLTAIDDGTVSDDDYKAKYRFYAAVKRLAVEAEDVGGGTARNAIFDTILQLPQNLQADVLEYILKNREIMETPTGAKAEDLHEERAQNDPLFNVPSML